MTFSEGDICSADLLNRPSSALCAKLYEISVFFGKSSLRKI